MAAFPSTPHALLGGVEGTVTDPKGSVVKDAAVTVKDPLTNQTYSGRTDNQGHYKIEGVPPGEYTLTIQAKGFTQFTKDIIVEDGKRAATDARLEIAPIESEVTVAASKANDDPTYQALRQASKQSDLFAPEYAVVNNLVVKRDAGVFTLRSGEVYFLKPVEGRQVGAVFIGDGEFYMKPPIEVEQKTLAIFTDAPDIKETFSDLVIRFTDKTFEEISTSPNVQMKRDGPRVAAARDLYQKKETIWRKLLQINLDQRTLMDIYKPERQGFFLTFIGGSRFNKLIYRIDPIGIGFVAPEQVTLSSYGESDEGIWASFHMADEYKRGIANSNRDRRLFDFTDHHISAVIKGTRLVATDKISMVPREPGERVIQFDFFADLRVKRVQDADGNDLKFIQENKDEDADFAVILPAAAPMGKTLAVTVEYEGDKAIRSAGSGNFVLAPRSSWYPSNGSGGQFGDRATFEMRFTYPKEYTFVGVGNQEGEDTVEGNLKTSVWTSGTTEMAVAGFNYGRFKKKAVKDVDAGYDLESYANEEMPEQIRAMQRNLDVNDPNGLEGSSMLGSMSTTGMAASGLADAQNSVRIYNAYFGKIPYSRIAITQQPFAFFGQAWPTLIYMPYMAYIDSTQRTQLMGIQMGTNTFWEYVAPHEIAHQWWGHTLGWTSYRDQWMSEGFAEFSSSLYVQFVKKDLGKFNEFWEAQRHRIVDSSPSTLGRKPYTVGPVTQGYRLNNAKTGSVARSMIYPKGAYILHMIRMMMFDRKTGDDKFKAMMQDFVKTNYNKDISTEDFKKAIEKHILPLMDIDKNGSMNWFFDEWVYGTEMPSYTFEYTVGKNPDGKATFSGKITQSGVSDNFAMIVPVYVDFGKGWLKLGASTIVGNSSVDIKEVLLPQAPEKAAICAMNDVLASSIQNKKR